MRCGGSAFDGVQKAGCAFLGLGGFKFVGFGEHEGVGAFGFREPVDEFQVDALGVVAGVDEHHHHGKVGAVGDVFGDELLEGCAAAFGDFRVTVTWKVDEAEGAVDAKKIDELGATWSLGDAGEGALTGQKIEKR